MKKKTTKDDNFQNKYLIDVRYAHSLAFNTYKNNIFNRFFRAHCHNRSILGAASVVPGLTHVTACPPITVTGLLTGSAVTGQTLFFFYPRWVFLGWGLQNR